jgi:hypothetical protein
MWLPDRSIEKMAHMEQLPVPAWPGVVIVEALPIHLENPPYVIAKIVKFDCSMPAGYS